MPLKILISSKFCVIFRFLPYKPGRYTVDVRCGGQSIENSPFVMRISEAETVSVKLKEFEKEVNRSVLDVTLLPCTLPCE